MGIAALTLVVLVVLGWALRLIFRRFGVKCRTPVRRQPKGTDRLRGLEEGSRVEIRKGSSTAVKTLGLEVNDNLIKIQQIVYSSYSYTWSYFMSKSVKRSIFINLGHGGGNGGDRVRRQPAKRKHPFQDQSISKQYLILMSPILFTYPCFKINILILFHLFNFKTFFFRSQKNSCQKCKTKPDNKIMKNVFLFCFY